MEFTNNCGTLSSNYVVYATVGTSINVNALAIDSMGDLFVTIYEGGYVSTILEITPDGLKNTFASGFQVIYFGLAFNSSGALFLDAQNFFGSDATVEEFTTNGSPSTFVDGLNEPSFLAFQPALPPPNIAPAGNQSVLFWPTDYGNLLLQSVTNLNSTNWVTVTNGTPISGFTVTNALPSQFFRLQQQGQNLFVTDYEANDVVEITPDGATNVYAAGFNGPTGLAFDCFGYLFVANLYGTIVEVTPNGTQIPFASGLDEPYQLAFDSSGNLYEADFGSGNIYKFSPNGTRSLFASDMTNVTSLVFDTNGDLFVAKGTIIDANTTNNIVEFKNNNGTLSSNYVVFATIPYAYMLAIDGAGDVFSTEAGGDSIWKIAPSGSTNYFASEDVVDCLGMAFDNTGNLFVAVYGHSGSGAIDELAPNGSLIGSVGIGPNDDPICLASPPAPPLDIAPAGNQAALFWPAASGNFLLQSIPNLSCTNWTTVTNDTPITGFILTNTSPKQFFRMQEPQFVLQQP